MNNDEESFKGLIVDDPNHKSQSDLIKISREKIIRAQ
jgi:hypothetical protein